MSDIQKKVERMELDFNQVTRTKSILGKEQVQKLWTSTHSRYKYTRPGKGGGQWTFVKVGYVRQVLDSVFGFDWSFDIETSASEAFDIADRTGFVVLKGTLTGNVVDDTNRIRTVKKTQFGRAEVKINKTTGKPLDFGNDLKAAASDCLKKCASLLGVASDIYDGEDFIEVIITDAKTDRTKQTEKKVQEVKRALIAEEVADEPRTN